MLQTHSRAARGNIVYIFPYVVGRVEQRTPESRSSGCEVAKEGNDRVNW